MPRQNFKSPFNRISVATSITSTSYGRIRYSSNKRSLLTSFLIFSLWCRGCSIFTVNFHGYYFFNHFSERRSFELLVYAKWTNAFDKRITKELGYFELGENFIWTFSSL